jgi:hypothetical protein
MSGDPMPRSNQGPAPSAATCWPLHHNRRTGLVPIMAASILPPSLNQSTTCTIHRAHAYETIVEFVLSANQLRNIGPDLGGGFRGMGTKIGAGLSVGEPALIYNGSNIGILI